MRKKVFITGISSGIGLDTTKVLINNGFHVYGTVRKLEDQLKLLKTFPDKLTCFRFDITDDNALDDCIMTLKTELGGQSLFALINNAGIAVPGIMHMISDEDFEKQMNVNLIATRKITNRIIPLLGGQQSLKPRIVFISSVSGIFATPFNGPYCVSKHALECLVDIYRRELKFLDIDVICIQPGPIKTKIWSKAKGRFDKYKTSVFKNIAEKADDIIEITDQQALPVSRVSMLILNILNNQKNRNRYMVHKKALLLKFVSYCLPSKCVDYLIWKNLGKSDTKSYRPV